MGGFASQVSITLRTICLPWPQKEPVEKKNQQREKSEMQVHRNQPQVDMKRLAAYSGAPVKRLKGCQRRRSVPSVDRGMQADMKRWNPQIANNNT